MTATKVKQNNIKKQRVLYSLEEELTNKISKFDMDDTRKELCLKLCLESAKEGIEKFLEGSEC